MRYLQIDLELFGEDDAGNDMEVYLKTNEMPWYNLFEKQKLGSCWSKTQLIIKHTEANREIEIGFQV